ncbi:MAG: hypothetical protein R2805_11310 [Flavobacterium sp.]|uniref:hypothetical protein n=1 Tax=Flavobacterium sp. TaxID=239 RepID=UPI00352809F1
MKKGKINFLSKVFFVISTLNGKSHIFQFIIFFSYINFSVSQTIEGKVSDTIYFKFEHNKNQELKYQKTKQNKNVGEYYYNYLGSDKQPYIIFTFNFDMPSTILKKSGLRKRKIKYIDYSFFKNKSIKEISDYFNKKIIFLYDSREVEKCNVKLKQVIFQSSELFEM